MKRTALISASFLMLNLAACVLPDKTIGDDDAADDETGDGDGDPGDGDPGDGDPGDGDGEPTDECGGPFSDPKVDPDCDSVGLACDNARYHRNPDQRDQDGDDFGDVSDLCPLIAGNNNTADSDRDGIGNACDRCQYQVETYGDMSEIADPRLWVRNIPTNADFDQDGVGDACDNCVAVANCQSFGPDDPAPHGAEAEAADDCQADADLDGIGDACIDPDTMMPISGPTAAGPVGFGATDDFDQDGIGNMEDACPRLPLEVRIQCSENDDCNTPSAPGASTCSATPANDGKRYCNHRDIDGDQVGDACDTCPGKANGLQVTDTGMQIDDEDGDFIGAECEISWACNDDADPRPIRFWDASSGGLCCTTIYPGDDVLHDPYGVPIRVACSPEQEAAEVCRKLPASVATMPGVVDLPLDCDGEATELTIDDVGGDPLALWEHACWMPASDQDFDGVGDSCDTCRFAWDPTNTPYTDDEGMLWPEIGAVCAGDFGAEHGAWCQL